MYLHVMNTHSHILIIGGGLAGLISAIHLAQKGMQVTLIEKDSYPKHKVCGEYISNEVLPYFEYLSLDIASLLPVKISKFSISTQNGHVINSALPLGGFGVSRYTLDHYLWKQAKAAGVHLINDLVVDIQYKKHSFIVTTQQNRIFTSNYAIGAYGKRSVLDKTLSRNFGHKKSPWLAIKMHYEAPFDSHTVALHNFEGGYCGLSMVENNKINACYLVHYDSFKRYKDIDVFQKEILYKNPYLNEFFKNAKPLFDQPLTISQINFEKKKPIENHIFMMGDAAGLIHPLCGNGMAMAIQSAQILSVLLINNHMGVTNFSREEIEKKYLKQWVATFSKRLYSGRVLQKVLLNNRLQKVSYKFANAIPAIVPKIIKQTHGEPIIVC